LQSKTLMRKVVNRLHLDVSYQTEGRIMNSDFYEKRPFNLVTIEMNPLCYGKDLIPNLLIKLASLRQILKIRHLFIRYTA
jgi:hypothetical protein